MTNARTKTYLGLVVFACLAGGNLQAQVDLESATYGTDSPSAGMAPVASGTNTLGPITVTQIYTNSTSTYTYNFVSDASGVSNYIYVPITSAPDPFSVGSTYTGLTLDSTPFGSAANGYNFELTVDGSNSTGALTPTATGVTPTYTPVSQGLLSTASGMTDNYTGTPPGDTQPVQFTFTAPSTTTVNPVTGNYTGTDPNTGNSINFYRPTNGLSFVAGTTYTIDGYAFVYKSGTEIYDPSIVTNSAPAPEPSTYALVGFGVVGLLFVYRRKHRAKLA